MRAGILSLLVLMAGVAAGAEPGLFDHPAKAEQLTATLLKATAKQLADTQVLRGEFLHRKHLAGIPSPLDSNGEFMFIRGQGLFWHTQRPFDSVFILTPRGMRQKDEGGREITTDAESQPTIRAVATIFLALFALDLPALDKDFELYGQPDKEGWLLGLKPKAAAMSAVFSQATISGDLKVRKVELLDAYGDRTVIELQNTQLLTREPTPQELAILSR